MFGRLKRLVGRPEPAPKLPPEIFVALPLGWQSGLHPDAADEAKDSVRNDPGCLSLAYDSTKVGQAYVPALRVGTQGMPEPGDDFAEWLDGTETVFRDAMADPKEEARIQSLERVRIPAGEALRVEFSSGPEPSTPLEIAQVQYYVPTAVGFFALWFMCEASDVAGYRATFDEMAQTFLRTDLHPTDYLDEFVLKATT